ncbi:MAG TPA: SPOR domain-containing protein [Thermoanaerobaculia bacterium]
MAQPPTHYQVSFTARQGLSLFVGLLAALGLAYFFGLRTGLSGREPQAAGTPSATSSAAETPSPTSPAGVVAGGGAVEDLTFPPPVTGVASAGGPAVGAPSKVQVFEDGEAGARAAPPARAPARAVPTPRPVAPSGAFRVQVLSVSSRAEADAEAARLARKGFPSRVEPGSGPKGSVYRVRVGPYATREEAEQAGRRLTAQGHRDAWIVSPGQ